MTSSVSPTSPARIWRSTAEETRGTRWPWTSRAPTRGLSGRSWPSSRRTITTWVRRPSSAPVEPKAQWTRPPTLLSAISKMPLYRTGSKELTRPTKSRSDLLGNSKKSSGKSYFSTVVYLFGWLWGFYSFRNQGSKKAFQIIFYQFWVRVIYS